MAHARSRRRWHVLSAVVSALWWNLLSACRQSPSEKSHLLTCVSLGEFYSERNGGLAVLWRQDCRIWTVQQFDCLTEKRWIMSEIKFLPLCENFRAKIATLTSVWKWTNAYLFFVCFRKSIIQPRSDFKRYQRPLRYQKCWYKQRDAATQSRSDY